MSAALLKAVTAGRPRQVRLLLDSGSSVDTCDDCGQTPLIRAVFIEHSRNRERIVRMLLKHAVSSGAAASVSSVDVVGRSALSWACLYGREREVGYLLQHHMESTLEVMTQADVSGQTPLFHAVTSGNAACVKMICDQLQQAGFSLETPNHNGVTPLMQALKHGHDVCASILIQFGGASLGPDTLDSYKKYSRRIKTQWAQKCNGQKNTNNDSNNELFPPIIPEACIHKIQYRENRAKHSTFVTPLDSDNDDEDEDSTYGSSCLGMSSNTSSSSGSAYTGGRLTTMSFISTSSTEVNADSDEDVDSYSTPIHNEISKNATAHDNNEQQQNNDTTTKQPPQHPASTSANSHRPKAAKLKRRCRRNECQQKAEPEKWSVTGNSSAEESSDDDDDDSESSNATECK